ncbi:H+/Cl- antiporter ClcA [Saccharothrix tamanrassetensis]|uniref:H+/Cl- antiporter ClcA n=1 Tax=Saccharothrix tamanrassetensis TaxID=1051531 RepID=A0A841CNU1_9PSEU|nr:chloride channel protein [Saccharothrix tamanrassetensis]MBB5957196.1 H+/Cl- antiporter ClcA [Saccharothrix tamanrassetensis]
MSAGPSNDAADEAPAADSDVELRSRGYPALMLVAALVGIPLSLLVFGFLAAVHWLEHVVWETLPASLGFEELPTWWPIATIGSAGVLVALAVKHLPGRGGHVPAMGFDASPTTPGHVPGIVLAATTGWVLGAVIGPEAPLFAMGSGLALLAANAAKVPGDARTAALVAASGSAAAVSAVFGNPLVAVIMYLEVVGLGRRRTMLLVLPCLVSSGVGALVFTGLGRWTGLDVDALAIPHLEPARLDIADVVWTFPVAAVVAVATWGIFAIGRRTARLATSRTMVITVAAGLVAGSSAALYAVLTGRSPAEVALSGQGLLPTLATQPGQWSTGALVTLLLCKGLAYAVCLGAFRGGPVFPAIFIGAAFGVLASSLVPGIGTVPGLAIGMAAGAAVTRLPVTSVVLVVLLLGDAAAGQVPVVILAAVTAMVVDELLSDFFSRSKEKEPGARGLPGLWTVVGPTPGAASARREGSS